MKKRIFSPSGLISTKLTLPASCVHLPIGSKLRDKLSGVSGGDSQDHNRCSYTQITATLGASLSWSLGLLKAEVIL